MPFFSSSSTDSLPISYRSHSSICTSISTHTLSADIDTLHRLLFCRDANVQIATGALEEYAWRGIIRGTRVRDWCEGLRTVLHDLSITRSISSALQAPSIISLFPFLSLVSSPSATVAHFFYPLPSIPIHHHADLDRNTLVEALMSLLDAHDFKSEEDLITPVTELVLEHIGAVWRKSLTEDESGLGAADMIAKALTQLEFELQTQGPQPSLRALIFPIVRRIRFNLGFVTPHQLVSRLKSISDNTSEDLFSSDPFHLIRSFALRRLSTSSPPQTVYDSLIFIRERVRDASIERIVDTVLGHLGLEHHDNNIEVSADHTPMSPTIALTPSTPTKRGFTFFTSKKMASRKTMIAMKPQDYQISSPISYPAGFNPDRRRPSLPSLSPSTPIRHNGLSSPLASSSLTSFHTRVSIDSPSVSRSVTSDLLSQIMGLQEVSDVRLILLDYIVDVRYQLHVGGENDWYFGSGREGVASTLDSLEGRLVGKRDVMDLKAVFEEIRATFDIPIPGSSIRGSLRSRHQRYITPPEALIARYATPPDIAASPATISSDRRLSKISFELDSYYHGSLAHDDGGNDDETMESLSEETIGGRRRSFGASSQFSFSSCLSSAAHAHLALPDRDRDRDRENRYSIASSDYNFSIREAKVGYAEEAITLDQPHSSNTPTTPRYLHTSRSESSLIDAAASHSSSTTRLFLDRLSRHSHSPPSSTQSHLTIPRSESPSGSFHSLLSALDLETRIPVEMLDVFLDTSLLSPSPTPTTARMLCTTTPTTDQQARRKQNRQCVVVDNIELSPDGIYTDLALEPPFLSPGTPILEHTRRRFTSAGTSTSTLDSIDELTAVRSGHGKNGGDLPFAQLLALFSGKGTKSGMKASEVEEAVAAFVYGEMRDSDELGEGWDGEDQRRIIWLLKQISAMISDPELQYPIQQQILYLTRNPPTTPSNRTSQASSSTSSGSTVSASTPTTTNQFLTTTTSTTPASSSARSRKFVVQNTMNTPTTQSRPITTISTPSPSIQGYSLGVTLVAPDSIDSITSVRGLKGRRSLGGLFEKYQQGAEGYVLGDETIKRRLFTGVRQMGR